MKPKHFKYLLVVLFLLCGNLVYAKIYLVSAGIGDYSGYPQTINNLRLTVEDAKTITYIYSKNGDTDYRLLLNEQATKENIISSIESVLSKATENDIAVFFFSGHGYTGGLCAYDGDIEYELIRAAMAKSKCKNKMMFIDACKAGGLRVQTSNSQNAINAAKKANILLFLSSRTNENSIERRDMTNGFFTFYLQKGLRGNADINYDRVITAKELYNFVHRGVTSISNDRQHPVMWGKFNDNMPVIKW